MFSDSFDIQQYNTKNTTCLTRNLLQQSRLFFILIPAYFKEHFSVDPS